MEKSTPAGVIVCEQTGQWAAGLLREFVGAAFRVQQTRLLDDAWQALSASPAALVVAEFTSKNADELLRRGVWFSRDFPRARLAIVAVRRFASYGPLLLAAGAVHAVFSTRDLAALAEMSRRHMASIPQSQLPLSERIWLSLPWDRNRPAASPAT